MDKNEKKVSVIIPTYNRPVMLERAINSVLEQTYRNIEIVVVDDNNPNTIARQETEEVMLKFENHECVKYVKHDSNQNGAVARNTGIKYSSGELICFLDDDDWYLPNKIQTQVEFLLDNLEFKAVYGGWIRNGDKIIPDRQGDLSYELLSGTGLIYTNVLMMWKHIAVEIGGWDISFRRNQEAAFLLRFFKSGYEIGVVEEVLVEFDTSDRSNASDANRNRKDMEYFLKIHDSNIEKINIKNAKKKIYSHRYLGVILKYIKEKKIKEAFFLYIEKFYKMPLTFNLIIIRYIRSKIKK